MRIKRTLAMLLSAILTLSVCLLAMPDAAKADYGDDTYTMDFSQNVPLSWNGTSVNYATTDDSGTGWSWTYANKTLTLTGLRFSTEEPVALKLPDGATIKLDAGSSNIVMSNFHGGAASTEKVSSGIWCMGALTVSGGGTLTAHAGFGLDTDLHDSTGVKASEITLSGSCLLTGQGGGARDSYGVALTANGSITVKESASLMGKSGPASSHEYGVFVPTGGSITVQDSGCIDATSSGQIAGAGIGISSPTTTVKGGTLIAFAPTGGKAMAGAPDLTQYTNYSWRTTLMGDYTNSNVRSFTFNQSLDYIEICPPAAAPPISITPASTFVQGAAPAIRLTVRAGITGFNATNNLDSVAVNGTTLTSGTHYTPSDGSILIDFAQSWLNSLTPGNYAVTVTLKGGAYQGVQVGTSFTVTAPGGGGAAPVDVPKTGDGAAPGLWLGLLLLAGAGLGASVARRRRAR